MTTQIIMSHIDTYTEPRKMSKEKAIDVLKEVISECRSRIEYLQEEIENEENEE